MAFTTLFWFFTGAAGFVLYRLFLAIVGARQPGLKEIPGPWLGRYTNLVLKWHVLGGQRTKYVHSLHQKYGDMVRIAPTEVAVADISAFRDIHRVGTKFCKSRWYRDINHNAKADENENGIFAMQSNSIHAARRKLFSKPFSYSTTLLWEDQIKHQVRTAVEKIKRDALAGTADILMWWTFLATDTIGEMAFGESFNTLVDEKKTPYIKDMELAMVIGGLRAEFIPLVSFLVRLPIPVIQHAIAVFARLRKYGQLAVNNARSVSVGSHKTLFSKMLEESTLKDELSDDMISSEATNMILAGTDTTSVSLTYLIWCVLTHPHVNKTLQAELCTCSADPTAKELEALPYLNRVIDETLRLYSAVPASLPRETPATGAMLAGYHIPGGTTVGTQAYTFHRTPAVFPDPEKFDPDRWVNPTREMKEAFVPMSAGSRSCLGVHIAKLQLWHATVAFFRACPDAQIAPATTAASMEIFDYFVIAPVSHKCEITLAA